ncbi:MAG TPA: hypothetical protein VG711_00720, partial [Phycisphaerales bacterium]|nr:hypothetical protein [Phycisphaerales bacterium]
MLFVEDFLNSDEFDDALSLLEECGGLGLGVGGVGKRDEEAALAVFAMHDSLECINVGTADLFALLDLHRE